MKKDRYFGISPRIARWKINTPIENWLSHQADRSEFWKRLYVAYYQLFDRKYYQGGMRFIQAAIDSHQEEWKNYDRDYIVRDMIYCLHRFGLSFQDYCIYGLIDKTPACRAGFVADKLRYHYCDLLNGKDILPLMTDKYACYLQYKPFFKREVLGCFEEKDYPAFEEFVSKHAEFIFKPLEEHSGHGIAKCRISGNGRDFFQEKLKSGAFVVEEIIRQGPELAAMHPQSVNSFRVVTFTLKDKVHILGITWRIGTGNAVMDNAGSGGIYASVDPQLGIVVTDAINYKGDRHYVHPDTGVQIVGFRLPQWQEALKLVQAMATHRPDTTLIAWDIAYSDNGWLMIEANDNGDWSILQSNKKMGKKAELYQYMDQYFSEQ